MMRRMLVLGSLALAMFCGSIACPNTARAQGLWFGGIGFGGPGFYGPGFGGPGFYGPGFSPYGFGNAAYLGGYFPARVRYPVVVARPVAAYPVAAYPVAAYPIAVSPVAVSPVIGPVRRVYAPRPAVAVPLNRAYRRAWRRGW